MSDMWFLSLLIIPIAVLAQIFLSFSISRMTGELKEGMKHLFTASSTGLFASCMTVILLYLGIPLTNVVWNAVPICFFLAMVFFFANTKAISRVFNITVINMEKNRRTITPYYKN